MQHFRCQHGGSHATVHILMIVLYHRLDIRALIQRSCKPSQSYILREFERVPILHDLITKLIADNTGRSFKEECVRGV